MVHVIHARARDLARRVETIVYCMSVPRGKARVRGGWGGPCSAGAECGAGGRVGPCPTNPVPNLVGQGPTLPLCARPEGPRGPVGVARSPRIVLLIALSRELQGRGEHRRRTVRTTTRLSAAAIIALVAIGCVGLRTATENGKAPEAPVPTQKGGDVDTRRVGEAVVLDKVEPVFDGLFERWKAGEGTPWCERSDTYMFLTCMRVAGWNQDYAEVITVSGYGPSFGYSQEKWGAHYHPPPDRVKRIGDATGFGFLWEQKQTPEEYWEALKRSIDGGTPVRAPYGEGVLFIGYRDAERVEDRQVRPLARVFVERGSWWTWEQFCDWHKKHSDGGWFGRHTGKVETIPPKDSAVEILRLIVRMATDDPRGHMEQFEGVTWGLPGILAYADDLADLSKSGAKEGEGGYFQGGWRGCHNIYPQMSGRPAAATYLKRVAPLFGDEAKRHILAAAAAYDGATDAWREFERQLGRPLGDKHCEAWQDPAHRKAGATAVREAHDHEALAIDEIKKALAAEGADVAEVPPNPSP